MKKCWILLIILIATGHLTAASTIMQRQLPLRNNLANDLFQQQKYPEALKSYLDLYGQETGDGALAYNIGNTYAAMGDMEKAAEFYEKAISAQNGEAANRARFNLGNLQMANQKMQDAVKQYADYLRANPDDQDAKRNLEIALKMMEQQQQQQQDQENQENQDQENQDQENQDQQSQQNQENKDQESQDQQQQDQENQDQENGEQGENQDQQDEQDQQSQEEKDKQDQKEQEEKEKQQQQEAQAQENKDKMDDAMKEQILQALSEQEMKQQKEYQKRKIGPQRRRAKDW